MARSNRFAALRQLREQRNDEDPQEQLEEVQNDPAHVEEGGEGNIQTTTPEPMEKPQNKAVAEPAPPKPAKRGPGRPRGRRSNPDYTQISAYIPLDLLLEVQDELAEERREKRQRTARPVSDLMEELLYAWLKTRKRENSAG